MHFRSFLKKHTELDELFCFAKASLNESMYKMSVFSSSIIKNLMFPPKYLTDYTISYVFSYCEKIWQPWTVYLYPPFDRHKLNVGKNVFVKKDMTFFTDLKWFHSVWSCLSNYAFKIIRISTHHYSIVHELWTTKENTDMECWLPNVFGIVHYHTVQRIWTVIEVLAAAIQISQNMQIL